ncbi:MAG: insulinase family protein [Bacteroidetes bacterium]|nr:insulinase family protein [Bacteroidota bacterium]
MIAENLGNKIAFGYPHPLSYEIKEAEINNFTVQECKSFLKACYQPQNIVLVVYGNFNQKIVQTELIKRFGAWKNEQDIKLPSIKTSLPPAPNNYFMTPIPNGDSTIIAIKYPLDLILKDENYLPSKLLEIILKNRLNTINGIGNIIDLNITPKRYVGLFDAKFKVSNLVVPSVLKT